MVIWIETHYKTISNTYENTHLHNTEHPMYTMYAEQDNSMVDAIYSNELAQKDWIIDQHCRNGVEIMI